MNPFNLTGPQFLVFYLVLGVVLIGAMVVIRRSRERGEGSPKLSDPYLIAHLRGGKNEVLRVAVISLVERGLLEAQDTTLTSKGDPNVAKRTVERAILKKFKDGGSAESVFSDSELEAATNPLAETLEGQGLIPNESLRMARRGRLALVEALLLGIAFLRVMQALSRGRSNIWFLVFIAAIFAVVAAVVHNPRRTAWGDAVLEDLRTLFDHLKGRAQGLKPGAATNEAVLLAAVFGLAALPAEEWAYTRKLYPKASTGSASSSGSCGSSCGSSGDSGGSSCGGGGCGGGCGGCGG